ncbi:hypothetical protein CN163_32595 [Sinorhizobium meliloti]|nr:hypothetical protein CN163_32595 [Sinorhizobium meliloti]
MDRLPATEAELEAVFLRASVNTFYPKATVRCPDDAVFRTQLARDLACLLDVDDTVVAWSTLCFGLRVDGRIYVPDFVVTYESGRTEFLDAVELTDDPAVTEAFACVQRRHRYVPRLAIEEGWRLQNAKDLLRYARHRISLNDRVRLLAALDETGSLTVAECFHLFRETQPMSGISWMVLNRFLSMDLDAAPIGPETLIRRFVR